MSSSLDADVAFSKLEKLRSWLDDALAEYEKSNRMLQNNYRRLQKENYTVRTGVDPTICHISFRRS